MAQHVGKFFQEKFDRNENKLFGKINSTEEQVFIKLSQAGKSFTVR